ncbi:MAG: hypothetical protein LBL00_05865 [Endomicrobium sp.]|jgi:hypothetical protein|nr:hypothetical protein [Endomicrobium sp.]
MVKKVFSLLFVLMFLLSGSASAASAVKTFFCAENNLQTGTNIIRNDIYFVKDHSKIITDVCKNFANNFVFLISLFNSPETSPALQNAFDPVHFISGIFSTNFTEKKSYIYGSFVVFGENDFSGGAHMIFFAVISIFILWYIGLLRLFSGNSFFVKQIKI